ncbi:outer membrane beta-barrel protein [Aridibaculum aurantiacum]|uniref:outer membrane beta-barrel protein n=1 Tax=Aridibaculum aurantiacum TaxID=2810307 RepID=UPI001A958F1E|nr:outer membrane beta-barrel protein [Aridibaculum aurantiacum]
MKHSTLLFVFAFFSLVSFGQSRSSGSVSGRLIDSVSNQELKDATISILDAADSALVVYGLSKADGSFAVENIPFGSYQLLISFQGYKEVRRPFVVTKEKTGFNAGVLHLAPLPIELQEVTVKTSPITIKGDTTEFNAGHFKTKPNATAEDLLKKLPGVEVEKDGTVKAQGENVRRVLVDGKRFFGDDPKTATRNLPTDMIDKIQVYDAQSDQSAFSGFDDGNREKTINIVTRKDRRKGMFGKATVGAGDNDRYAANLNFNKFNGSQQISFIGQGNNTNNQNFSIQDILGTMNSGGGGGGGNRGGGMQLGRSMANIGNFIGGTSPGIATTWAAGLNYNDAWSKKTSVSGSYFVNSMNTLNSQERFTENFTPNDSSIFRNNTSFSNNKNLNHRFNFEIDQKLDSMNSLLIRPSISLQESDNFRESRTFSTRGKTINQNEAQSLNNSQINGYNFNNSILYRRRFGKRGRSLSLNLTQAFNNSHTDRHTLNYTTTYFGAGARRDTIDQVSTIDRNGRALGANVSFTEPIGTKGHLEMSYNASFNNNNSQQETRRMNEGSGKYDRLDSILTNSFENSNNSHRIGINYRRQVSKEWNYTLGMAVQRATLESDNLTRGTTLSQTFNNFFPTVMLQYSKNRTKNLRINYRGSTRQPGINQLQEVIDNSNPLNITTGNAALEQEFQHSLSLFFTNIDIFTFKNFVASINGSFINNKIGNAYYINSTNAPVIISQDVVLAPLAQFTRPVNIDGAYNISGFINYGFPVKKPRSNINLTTNLAHSRDVNLINNVRSFTRNYVIGETVRYTLNLKERLDLNFASTSTFTMARYSQTAATERQQQTNGDFFTQIFSVEPTYTTKNGWVVTSDFDYTINRGQSEGFNQTIPLWTASIGRMFLKNKQGEIKLTVFDLLNQNKSITRNVNQNYIEDVRTQVLQRYFMLSFTYNLRAFKGQQQQTPFPMNMIPRGANRQIRIMQ